MPDALAKLSTIRVLGSPVHLVTIDQTVDQMERWIEERGQRCRRINVTGFHELWVGYEDSDYRSMLDRADLSIPDGIAPVWVSRIRGYGKVKRAPGAEVMREFFRRANVRGYSSYFYGDTESTLTQLQISLSETWPGHRIAGMYSPPFRQLTLQEDKEAIERINDAHPDVLWVGLGSPKQDRWIHERLAKLKVPVAIGVGAAFAFTAGTVKRCPAWLGSVGLEWAYRLSKEPNKLWRRDFIDGPRFLFHLGMELTGMRKYSE